jgi:hypothetical protein
MIPGSLLEQGPWDSPDLDLLDRLPLSLVKREFNLLINFFTQRIPDEQPLTSDPDIGPPTSTVFTGGR